MKVLRIATRRSALAVWQAEHVRQQLLVYYPDLKVELLKLETEGDQLLQQSLMAVGGKGLFVKSLENALLQKQADIAVHSLKDVTIDIPDGLILPVVLARADHRDAFLSERYNSFAELAPQAVVGTASLRRQSQLLASRPDLRITNLRGNVNTRLLKLARGEYDAIVLAVAGLQRLGYADKIKTYFPVNQLLPSVGQGVIAIECRAEDHAVQTLIKVMNDQHTEICMAAERAFNRHLGGGCHTPIAAYAELKPDNTLSLDGLVAKTDGSLVIRDKIQQPCHAPLEAAAMGNLLANQLLAQGAAQLLAVS